MNVFSQIVVGRWAVSLLALTYTGCGQTHDSPSTRTDVRAENPHRGQIEPQSVDGPDDYPDGPYGLSVGDISMDRSFFTDEDQALRLSDLHRAPEKKLLVIFGTAGWCTRCVMHMPGLIALHEQYADDGLVLAISIHENANYQPAKISDAHGYRRRHELPFNVLADTDAQWVEHFGEFSMPMIVVIDLDTMEILQLDRSWSLDEIAPWISDQIAHD